MGQVSNEATVDGDIHAVFQVGTLHGNVNLVPRPRPETPRQAAAPPPRFVDRTDLLTWLTELVADTAAPPRIAVLTGLPGVGKRTLARQFAHASRERFGGGDLWADCAAYARPPGDVVDVSGMVAGCLRGLGVRDEHMPYTPAERVALLRTRTADRPVLVMVENATEPAQVRALIPGAPGSLVLVTTSADLAELRLDGAVFRDITGLDRGSSAELFESVAGGPVGRDDLVPLCAGLPIAILVLASRVAMLHGGGVDELAGEVADERRRLAALSLGGKAVVSAAFTAVYERLAGDARQLYRRLGTFPGIEISAETAAAVSAGEPPAARRLLGTLSEAHLLERRPGGRYAFHELVRVHAKELAMSERPESRETARREIVRHYLVRAAFADRAVMGDRSRVADHDVLLAGEPDPFAGPDPSGAALAWLDGERVNLVAIVRTASEGGLLEETWQLAEALNGYYFNHRHLADWIAVSELGAAAARTTGNRRAEARLRIALSRAHTNVAEPDRAAAELDKAAGLAERDTDLGLLATVWEFRGKLLEQTDKEAALAAYRRSQELNAQAGVERGVALVLYYQGRTLDALERHGEAHDRLRRALEMLRALADRRMSARVLIALGSVAVHLGRDDEAAGLLRDALGELEGTHYEAGAREILAGIAERAGDRDAATAHRRRAVEIYRAEGHPRADTLAGALPDE